jgi:hypothetical protein
MEVLPCYLEFHLPTAIGIGPILKSAIDLNRALEIERIRGFVNRLSFGNSLGNIHIHQRVGWRDSELLASWSVI